MNSPTKLYVITTYNEGAMCPMFFNGHKTVETDTVIDQIPIWSEAEHSDAEPNAIIYGNISLAMHMLKRLKEDNPSYDIKLITLTADQHLTPE